jgi:hypothetical protein
MLYDFLAVRQVTPSNPPHSVRGPKYVVKKGKTPVLVTRKSVRTSFLATKHIHMLRAYLVGKVTTDANALIAQSDLPV